MNNKILIVAVAFFIIAMLATPLVSAKPTSAANNPKATSFVWHSENGIGLPPEEKTNPPWAEGSDVIVNHVQRDWELNPEGNNYVQIGEGAPIPIAVTDYEGHLYVQTVAKGTVTALNYRVYEKIMWGEGNYIDIMCNERATAELIGFDPVTMDPIIDFHASGTFVGQGVIDGQKVQVTGVREGYFDPMIGFVLDCYGTIRSAGN